MSVVAADRPRRAALRRSVSVPWRLGDLVTTYVANFVGAVLLLVAWWGASQQTVTQSQFVWVDVGIAGIVVAGTGNALWLLSGRRALARQIDLLLGGLSPGADDEPAATVTAAVVGELVAAPAMTRYHLADCPLVAGKQVRAARRATHERANRRPCGVCRP